MNRLEAASRPLTADGDGAAPDGRVSEAVRLVTARVADELSEPLAGLCLRIDLMLEEAADGAPSAALTDDLRALCRSARRLTDLVDALRGYSGDGAAARQPVRLNEVVSRALGTTRGHRVALTLDPEDPLILGDAAALERFVARVLVWSAPEDGVHVVTRAAYDEPHRVVLAVSGVNPTRDLIQAGWWLLAAHAGALDPRPIDDRGALVLTFPRLTLRLP